jgi:hypothetical protein
MKSILGFDYLLTPRAGLFLLDRHGIYLIGGVYSMFTEHLITGFFGDLQPDRLPRDV